MLYYQHSVNMCHLRTAFFLNIGPLTLIKVVKLHGEVDAAGKGT